METKTFNKIDELLQSTLDGSIFHHTNYVGLSVDNIKEKLDEYLKPYTTSSYLLLHEDLKIHQIFNKLYENSKKGTDNEFFELYVYILKRYKDILSFKRLSNFMPNDVKKIIVVSSLIAYAKEKNSFLLNSIIALYICQICRIPFNLPNHIFNDIKQFLENIIDGHLAFSQEIAYTYGSLLARKDTSTYINVDEVILKLIQKIINGSNTIQNFAIIYYYIAKVPISSLFNLVDNIESFYIDTIKSFTNSSNILELKFPIKTMIKIFNVKLQKSDFKFVESQLFIIIKLLNSEISQVREFISKSIAKFIQRTHQKDFCNLVLTELLSQNQSIQKNYINFVHGCSLTLGFIVMHIKDLDQHQIHHIIDFCINFGIKYDFLIGNRELGSNIRDSVAFIFWAIFKYYQPHVYFKFKEDLEFILVSGSLTDRERIVRYAFSSALQEYIGRSNYADVKLIQLTSMMNIGMIKKSFSQLTSIISINPSLLSPLIRFLSYKSYHWDFIIADLASEALCQIYSMYVKDINIVLEEYNICKLKFDQNSLQCQAFNHARNLLKCVGSHLSYDILIESTLKSYQVFLCDQNVRQHEASFIFMASSLHYLNKKIDIDIDKVIAKLIERASSLDKNIGNRHKNLTKHYCITYIFDYWFKFQHSEAFKYAEETFKIFDKVDTLNTNEIMQLQIMIFIPCDILTENLASKSTRIHYLWKNSSITLKCIILKLVSKYGIKSSDVMTMIFESLLNFKKNKNGDIGLKIRKTALEIICDQWQVSFKDDLKVLKQISKILVVNLFGNINFAIACFNVFREMIYFLNHDLFTKLNECWTINEIIDVSVLLVENNYGKSIIKSLFIMPSSNFDYFQKAIDTLKNYFLDHKIDFSTTCIIYFNEICDDEEFLKDFYVNFLKIVSHFLLVHFPHESSELILRTIKKFSSKKTLHYELNM